MQHYLGARHGAVEHVEPNETVADHEEERASEHGEALRGCSPPHGGGEPADVERNSHGQHGVCDARAE